MFENKPPQKPVKKPLQSIWIWVAAFLGIFLLVKIYPYWEKVEEKVAQIQEQKEAEKQESLLRKEYTKKKSVLLFRMRELVEQEKYKDALAIARPYMSAGDQEFLDLVEEAERKDERRRKEQLAEVEKRKAEILRQRELKLLEQARKIPASRLEENLAIYKELKKLNRGEARYREKYLYYQTKIEEEQKRRQRKIAEEKKRRQRLALSRMRKTVDEFEGITWYEDRSTTNRLSAKSFNLYIGTLSGQHPWLRLRVQYAGSDWLFIKSFSVLVDGERFEKSPANFERDHYVSIWEWYDERATAEDIRMVKKIISSKKAVVRLYGNQYHSDMVITRQQKQALQHVLDAYEALKKQ